MRGAAFPIPAALTPLGEKEENSAMTCLPLFFANRFPAEAK